ncbi:ATP-binding protein [Microbacterium invictum]|uniref:DUF4062 domain-containing protein n=1 Tax=Microbacterium invictum TaxID=515415 RepID=A0ABZ0V8R2_9MICO|nr:DUF4062 domain-containing protein [Microbacterium invictum]WQB70013.1 DUF4062 domain-containing protein [Microbacterium invictum]
MTTGPPPRIRTPDQRLRVFVSSTLRELAEERAAVREAIERLRLAPVMFELGARPHPPRDLYRAYLEQSDVFVGVYGERYGWVAPGEEISGLEDEYRLTPRAMPKLIYLRDPAEREPRLDELVARIQDDDTASYKTFGSPEELAELVEADLATLLAERFDAGSIHARPDEEALTFAPVPTAYTPLIGREADVDAVADLVRDGGHRLVTLLGPGGIGKSRLAIAVAEAVGDSFDGVVFVALENVFEPDLLLPSIASALGIRDNGEIPLRERLAIALADRRLLLILDNLEQLVEASPELVHLYTLSPRSVLLATTRTVLRVRGERVYEVLPLATHDPASPSSIARAMEAPAARLFVERAQSVQPSFAVTPANTPAVVGIVQRLQGLPLAIELAAARVRLLPPAAILARLDDQLSLLAAPTRDLPERQRTIRATIEWSTGLLPPTRRELLSDLGVFSYDFTLESVEAIGAERPWAEEVLEALTDLVDSCLVSSSDVDGQAVFRLPVSVREHSIERLRAEGRDAEMRDRHARRYVRIARAEAGRLGGPDQRSAVERLALERSNLRSAVRHLVLSGDAEAATDAAFALFLFWWIAGYLGEIGVWMQQLLDRVPDPPPRARAVAAFYLAWNGMWLNTGPELPARLDEASALFRSAHDDIGAALALSAAGIARVAAGDPDLDAAADRIERGRSALAADGVVWGAVLGAVALGRLEWMRGDNEAALVRLREGRELSMNGGDLLTETIITHHFGRALLFDGQVDASADSFARSLEGSVALRHDEGIAYSIEGLAAIAAHRGQFRRAGVLSGAAESIRRRTAAIDAPAFVFHTSYLAQAPDPDEVRRGEADGREYGALEAAAFALAGAHEREPEGVRT